MLPGLLAILANNRNRKPVPWALLGAIPLVNILGLILLLWTPLPSELEADDLASEHPPWEDQRDDPPPP